MKSLILIILITSVLLIPTIGHSKKKTKEYKVNIYSYSGELIRSIDNCRVSVWSSVSTVITIYKDGKEIRTSLPFIYEMTELVIE